MARVALHWQIFIAMALALMVGRWAGETATVAGMPLFEIFAFVGQLFLRALRMLVVPLIAAAIVTAVAGLGAERAFARLGMKTALYFLGTGLVATLIGLGLVNGIQPGLEHGQPVSLGLTADPAAVQAAVGERGARDVVEVFLRMFPENVVQTAGNNADVLALIVFCLLFGYYTGRLEGKAARTLNQVWQGIYDVMLRITGLVMKFAPLGIFALVAQIAATTHLEQLRHLLTMVITTLAGLALHAFIVMPLLLWLLGRVNPWRAFRGALPALLTAFSTSSSSVTLPLTLECVRKNAGVSHRVGNFIVPLGATVNMNGTALYACVASIFIAQLYGLHLTPGMQLIVVLLALLTSIGVAGVPAGGLVAVVVILGAMGLPPEGIGLIMVVDRVLDMPRTAVNVFGDVCGAIIIARSEGETHLCPKG
ncbi:MAG TPA: dicarboxylate/amino acid:cation symporter [Verrucomicrobiota bacterium]|nr:dicarboxylate/amino acid:cation symporter [Verrucomicrobiota bacterium]